MDIFDNTILNEINEIRKLSRGNLRIGFTASHFDILNSDHVLLLKEAKTQCDILVVGLQTDLTLDRLITNKPVQSWSERKIMVDGIKYIDFVLKYSTEKDLHDILVNLQPDVRILYSDCKEQSFTGNDLTNIPIYWYERNDGYSTSNLRRRIYNAEFIKIVYGNS